MLLSTFLSCLSVCVCVRISFGSIPSSGPYRSQFSSTLEGDVNFFPKILYQLHFYNQSVRVLIVSTRNSRKQEVESHASYAFHPLDGCHMLLSHQLSSFAKCLLTSLSCLPFSYLLKILLYKYILYILVANILIVLYLWHICSPSISFVFQCLYIIFD